MAGQGRCARKRRQPGQGGSDGRVPPTPIVQVSARPRGRAPRRRWCRSAPAARVAPRSPSWRQLVHATCGRTPAAPGGSGARARIRRPAEHRCGSAASASPRSTCLRPHRRGHPRRARYPRLHGTPAPRGGCSERGGERCWAAAVYVGVVAGTSGKGPARAQDCRHGAGGGGGRWRQGRCCPRAVGVVTELPVRTL